MKEAGREVHVRAVGLGDQVFSVAGGVLGSGLDERLCGDFIKAVSTSLVDLVQCVQAEVELSCCLAQCNFLHGRMFAV